MSDLILDLSFFPNFDSSPPFMSLLYIRHHKLLNPISKNIFMSYFLLDNGNMHLVNAQRNLFTLTNAYAKYPYRGCVCLCGTEEQRLR